MSFIKELFKKGKKTESKISAFEIEEKSEQKEKISKELIKDPSFFQRKSEELKVPLKEVTADTVKLETLQLIPEETVRHYQMVPLSKKGNVLEVGMVYPEDIKAQEALKFLARQGNFTYKVFLITPNNFDDILKQYRTLKREVGKALKELKVELEEEKKVARPKTVAEFERLAEEAPITKIVAVMLRHAVEGKASDIHIEPTRDKLRVRFRSLGILHSSIILPLRVHPAIVARVKVLSNLKLDESRIPQDGRFSIALNGKNVDFRVSTFPTSSGEKVAIRILDPTLGFKELNQLAFRERDFNIIQRAIKKPYGLILATGPTGCGKTTTLYAIFQSLNKEGVNIVTLEDPVEYFIEGVNQSQVRPEIGYDFATGLRHVLRQDPDIIMVGEVRDSETASLVIHSALTGHIVLSTLHTNNAAGVIPRLIDMGIQPYLIAPTLSVGIAQRLVRKLCSDCKKEVKPKKEVADLILKEIENLPPESKKNLKLKKPLKVWQARGCKKCGNSGFIERVALFEVLSMTEELSNMILKEPSEFKIVEEAKRQGMTTMKQDGILKALEGITTIEEVLRVATEK